MKRLVLGNVLTLRKSGVAEGRCRLFVTREVSGLEGEAREPIVVLADGGGGGRLKVRVISRLDIHVVDVTEVVCGGAAGVDGEDVVLDGEGSVGLEVLRRLSELSCSGNREFLSSYYPDLKLK